MSMGHVYLCLLEDAGTGSRYQVHSIDHSKSGRDKVLIGVLELDYLDGSFRFVPADDLESSFMPPELIHELGGVGKVSASFPERRYTSGKSASNIVREALRILADNKITLH